MSEDNMCSRYAEPAHIHLRLINGALLQVHVTCTKFDGSGTGAIKNTLKEV